MTALIEKILITERVRKEITKIDELADDIKRNGLINPITVMQVDNGVYRLLAGLRRLKAVEKLGETIIEIRAVSPDNAEAALRIEISENEQREPFSLLEKVEFGNMLEVIEKAKARERMLSGKKIDTTDPVPNLAQGQKGKTRDIVAEKVGMGKTNYDKAKYIVKNAAPEVIAEIDNGQRSITGAYAELRAKEDSDKTFEAAKPDPIEENAETNADVKDDEIPGGSDVNSQEDKTEPVVETSKNNIVTAGLLSKADEEAIERNKAFNALTPQKKVVELQRQLKEERARAARAESELERLKELRHNDVFHKDGIINNLKERLTDAELRIKELENLYCPA